MRISDWSSDVCSSDLHFDEGTSGADRAENLRVCPGRIPPRMYVGQHDPGAYDVVKAKTSFSDGGRHDLKAAPCLPIHRSEEHTSELQSLMRISYAVFCLKKKKKQKKKELRR